MDKRFAVIIPARFGSTRFPGKPLAMIDGKMMVERVFERASKSVPLVWVATDDRRIYEAVWGFGGRAIMTYGDHKSGTDRCAEAAKLLSGASDQKIDVIINLQGDEPYIEPDQIDILKSCFDQEDVKIATLIREVSLDESLDNPNEVKVVVNSNMDALYFSRSPIPYIRDKRISEWTKYHTFHKHIGMYGFRTETLKKVTKLPPGELEIAESLEQNRWLENGYRIRCAVTNHKSVGIDTPEDLERITKKRR